MSAAALGAAVAFSVVAQDAAEAPAGADAGQAIIKPHPAEIMPLAPKSMLLDITEAGGCWFAVGDRGNIVISSNGSEWAQVEVPSRAALTAVSFADGQTGWAVGHDASIVATTDGGKTWKLQHFNAELEKPFLDVVAISPTRALAIGAYGLFKETSDGGQTWTDVDAPAVREAETHLNGVAVLGNGDLLIAGEVGMLAVSGDQGKTWSKLTAPYDNSLFGALSLGDKGAVLYGLRGNVYSTDDVRKGAWQKLDPQSVASMFGGATLANGDRALVGLNGVVLVVAASGEIRQYKSERGTPLSAAVAMGDTLLAVGESGVQTIPLK
ncbi:MAG: YCF48-related protein [Pseudomonadota bacterium]